MLGKWALTALLFVSSSAALGQATNCRFYGSNMDCTTTPPPPPMVIPPPQQQNLQPLINPADVGNSVMNSFERGRQQAMQMRQQQLEAERLRQEQEYEAQQEARANQPATVTPQTTFVAPLDTRMAIVTLVRQGHCPEAIDKALEAGDIELATNVQAFCNGATVTPAAP